MKERPELFPVLFLARTTTVPQPPAQALTFPTLTQHSFHLPLPKSTHYLTAQQSTEEVIHPVSSLNASSPFLFNFTMFFFFYSLRVVIKPTEGKTVLHITHWTLSNIRFHPYINIGVNTCSYMKTNPPN